MVKNQIYLDDYKNYINQIEKKNNCLVILDPPYDEWKNVKKIKAETIIAFCSPQSRHFVEKIYGFPRTEIVWYFKDGRWVSNNLPRITHNYIYVYGKTNSAFVGCEQETKPQKKGFGAIGKDGKKELGKRTYYPKKNKQLNSVIEFPRNMRSYGSWSKPKDMFKQLINWINPPFVYDCFAGSGSVGVACYELNINYSGIEINDEIYNIAKKRLDNLTIQMRQENLIIEEEFKAW